MSVADIRAVAAEICGHQASAADDIAWWQATLTIDRVLKHDGRCRTAAVAALSVSRAILAVAEHANCCSPDSEVIAVARAAGTIARGPKGIFAKDRASNVTLKTSTFNAGPAAVEALFAGAIDATYIGPSPAINAWQKSNGSAIRIIAGATSGGASLVVKPTITSPADLKGKKIASPQLGNTQDVALRAWLKKQGFTTNPEGGGDVAILPQDNAQTLTTFKAGDIDGAWVPE